MIAKIIEKNGKYYCSNCRLIIRDIRDTCPFCGDVFYNLETLITDKALKERKEEIDKYHEDKFY